MKNGVLTRILALTLATAIASPSLGQVKPYVYRVPILGVDATGPGQPAETPFTTAYQAGTQSGVVGQPLAIPAPSPSGGTAPYSVIVTGAMPLGLGAAANGAITGVPQEAGQFQLTVTAGDSAGHSTSAQIVLTITGGPAQVVTVGVSQPPPAEAAYGQPFSTTLSGSGGTGPYAFSSTNLPAGLQITGSTLHGSFEAAGTHAYTITATGPGSVGSQSFSTTVYAAYSAVLSSAPQSDAVAGEAISPITISATGGKAPYAFGTTGQVPPGLTFDATAGVLSGTPTATGTYAFALTAAQSLAGVAPVASPTYTMTVAQPRPLTLSGAPIQAEYGIGSTLSPQPSIAASGGTAPYAYAASGLPAGMTLSADGTTTGAPSSPGTHSFTLTATDSSPVQRTASVTHTVTAYAPLTIAVAKPSYLNSGAAPSGLSVTSTGGKGSTRSYSIASGSLPSGIALAPNGTFSGQATGSGEATFEIRVQDELGTSTTSAAQTLAYAPALALNATLADAERGEALTRTIATGGRGPIVLTKASGTLPPGTSLQGADLTGAPTANGTYAFAVDATDADGRTASGTVTVKVSSPPKAASRALLDDATYSGNGALYWSLRYPGPSQQDGSSEPNTAQSLAIASDPTSYAYELAGSQYGRSAGGTTTVTGVFHFSEDVVATSADQIVTLRAPDGASACPSMTSSALYEGSMDNVNWTLMGSMSDIRANAPLLSANGYGGNTYALNFALTPTTIRYARTTISSYCGNITTVIYLRSGSVK